MSNRYTKESYVRMVAGSRKSAAIQIQRRQHRINQYNLDPKLCKLCQSSIPYDRKINLYCSKSCAAKFNNRGIQRNYTTGLYAKKPCTYCGLETTNVKYCTTKCHRQHVWDVTKERINKTGNANINNSDSPSVMSKRFLAEQRGHECEICHNRQWNKQPIPLVLDHISGDSTNWMLDNLRLICPNCDAQTDTYKGKNVGNGRHWRKQRYKDGKSY